MRLGDAGIFIVSPDQVRSVSLRHALGQREIGGCVLAEAHCLSKCGHDFRPDYHYVGRFIREKAGTESAGPVLCLTATAKPDVKADIVDYFEKELGVKLGIFDRGTHSHRIGLSIPGGTAVTVGVANVAVQTTHRGQGIMTRMMLHQIRYVHECCEPPGRPTGLRRRQLHHRPDPKR